MDVVAVHVGIPGRGRYHVPGLRRAPALRLRLQALLLQAPGVRSIRISQWTENVLVRFDPELPHDEMQRRLRALAARARDGAASVAAGEPAAHGHAATATGDAGAAAAAPPWHVLSRDDDALWLGSHRETGLSETEAARRRLQVGSNTLPQLAPPSDLEILAAQLRSLPVALLAGSAVLSVLTGGLLEAVVTLGVVATNAGIGYLNESRAERTIRLLTGPSRRLASVCRDGRFRDVTAEQLVPGDLVMLKAGGYVPADARLLAVQALAVDESLLTGESLAQVKHAEALASAGLPLADRRNLVFMGSVVTGGSATAMVVATGVATEVGRIQQAAGASRPPQTPVQGELDDLGRRLVYLCGGVCGVVMALELMRGAGLLQALRSTIALAVAAVPEGLPMVATTTLALAMRELRDGGVLVRRLDAIESLGAVDVLCLDKTGTLTENRMAVDEIRLADGGFAFDGQALAPPPGAGAAASALRGLLEAVSLCNECDVQTAGGEYRFTGSPTERALLELAETAGLDVIALRQRLPRVDTDFRREGRRFMVSRHAGGEGGPLTAVKGSPEDVLRLCAEVQVDGRRQPLTRALRDAIQVENERMAGRALRVLGVARGRGAWRAGGAPALTWLGLVGMRDRLRPGIAELIATFHGAGIRTVMITGDQSATAYAVGRELALNRGAPLEILDSTHLERLDEKMLAALAPRVDVFSRVSPAHKLQIVEALQERGHIVAMTGDGINDGPALRRAHVGIAMGRDGSAAARDVADIVLETDDLQGLVAALAKGRANFANIHRSLHFLLATNLSEIGIMLAAAALGAGRPLNPMQLLWLNLVTDVLPGLGLAVEPPDPDILKLPPRAGGGQLIGRRDLRQLLSEAGIITGGALAAYLYGVRRYGAGPHASTIASISLTSAQLLHTHVARTEGRHDIGLRRTPANPLLRFAMFGSFLAEVAPLLVPPLRLLLGDTPLTAGDAMVSLLAAVAPFTVNEALQIGYFDRLSEAGAAARAPRKVTGMEEQR